ncbi:TetR/AcrR family transcriptional regulator [Streptomyces sp. NA02950]|uniref:TetR/AcrR family transcriptional regulator n=1 Tax=Streptomyces sp. NA02950 TaxID=2742137 RepID=UPI0015912D80|nr:TetR/AcrR family transcriptional regulator [Streptomyces sp. NA02950]QKV96233.1 TetR/AcrR family transcriptional regulator [Streptomyces sp. NA02950]
MGKKRYHHGELREALLDAAEALVRERGAEGWSLREASLQVGVSPSAAYHHFSSRDALVRALSGRVLARLGERLSLAVHEASGDDQQRLIAYARSYITWVLDDPAVARLAFSAGEVPPVPTHPHHVLSVEVDRLVDTDGLSPSARPGAEYLLWAAIHGLATLLVADLVRLDDRAAVDLQAERLVRTVLNGLAQEHPAAPAWPQARTAYTERLADPEAPPDPR